MDVGCSGGWTSDARPSALSTTSNSVCACLRWAGAELGWAAEVDTIEEQQLKRMQSGTGAVARIYNWGGGGGGGQDILHAAGGSA